MKKDNVLLAEAYQTVCEAKYSGTEGPSGITKPAQKCTKCNTLCDVSVNKCPKCGGNSLKQGKFMPKYGFVQDVATPDQAQLRPGLTGKDMGTTSSWRHD